MGIRFFSNPNDGGRGELLRGPSSDRVRVDVSGNVEEVLLADVQKIVIARGNGDAAPSVDVALNGLWQVVDYVVSSNEDALETTGVGDGLVDLDPVTPGEQTTLRD